MNKQEIKEYYVEELGFEEYDSYIQKFITYQTGEIFTQFHIQINLEDLLKIRICDCIVECCGNTIYEGKYRSVDRIDKYLMNYINEYFKDILGLNFWNLNYKYEK